MGLAKGRTRLNQPATDIRRQDLSIPPPLLPMLTVPDRQRLKWSENPIWQRLP